MENWESELPVEGIQNIVPVRGGDVNEAYRIDTSEGTYFLLVQPGRAEDFYAAEIAGLEAMKEAGISVPEVLANGRIADDAYLLLEYLEEGTGSQRNLGHMVAKMHMNKQTDGLFGFNLPHEGGNIHFTGGWTTSWRELFLEKRMDPLRDRLAKLGLWNKSDLKTYEKVHEVMALALIKHDSEPSLLHGDLWAGNYMFLADGRPALFDPSPLYGDREFDLGATTVFGGFDEDFYAAYDEKYPLTSGAWERIRFYKLYLLMVHLVKFGSVYAAGVNETMGDILSAK